MNFQDLVSKIREVLATPLYTIGNTEGTVGTTLLVALIILVSWWISHLLSRAILHAFERRGTGDPDKFRPYTRFVQISVLLVGFVVAFNTLGLKLTAVFAAGGLFAVAFGFAMKNIAENFVSGLILRLEKSIKHGDVVQVEGVVVKIKDVGIRFTLGRTLDDEDLMIPNSFLVQSMVTNRSLRDDLYRVRAPVGVTYTSDMKLVRETLEKVATAFPGRSQRIEPVVLMRGFGNSSVDFEVSVWIDDPWRAIRRHADLNEAIWWALQEAGIVIAFPQLDVHFDPPVMDSLQGLRRAG